MDRTVCSGHAESGGKKQRSSCSDISAANRWKAGEDPLSADRNSLAPVWDDVVYVAATVLDENGVLVPNASDPITFKITGPAVVAAVDSGDNRSHEQFQSNKRKAFQGRCFALLKGKAAMAE